MVREHVDSRPSDSEDITYIPELRRRMRGEHVAAKELAQCFPVSAPPAPPSLSKKELTGLRAVFQRLDADGDGWLSASDLYRAMRLHGPTGLRGVSRQQARDMLWEASLCSGPGLTFEGFTGAYARAKADTEGIEPRRLYHYIVYNLMDADANGTVTTDEVYRHFFSHVDHPDLVSGTEWLLDALPRGEDAQMSPGLFMRFMQSGALPTAQGPRGQRRARPSSAPASRSSRGHQRRSSTANSRQREPDSDLPHGSLRLTAKDKYLKATEELRHELTLVEQGLHIPGNPFSKKDGGWSSTARRTSMLDLRAIRRARHSDLSGMTKVWHHGNKEPISKSSPQSQTPQKRISRQKAVKISEAAVTEQVRS